MKYHIEFTSIAEKGQHGIHPSTKSGSTSAESQTILGAIQGFLNKKEEEGVKIIKLKVQEDALNS